MLAAEKELIGFYISGHPLAAHEWTLKTFAQQRIGKLDEIVERLQKGEKDIYVRLGGMIDQYRKVFTKKDPPRPYARFVVEGLDGAINAVIWPDDFQTLEPFLEDGKAIMVGAKLALDFRESPEVQVSEIIPLVEAGMRYTKKVSIHLTEAAATLKHLEEVQAVVARSPGITPLSICILLDTGEKVFVKAHRDSYVEATQHLGHELEQLLGEDSVYIESRQSPLLKPPAKRRWQRK
jgi:DNA polymerase-3 subunit alpha